MFSLQTLLCLAILPSAMAFFMMGGSSCGCPAPACPPAPVAAPCASPCPPHPPCAVVHGAKTHPASPAVPDELELRAAAFGIPIGAVPPPTNSINQLERLGDSSPGTATAGSLDYKTDDADLFAGLRRSADIRRAPTVKFSQQKDVETTTVIAEVSTVKGEETETANNKCNSQVLHRLMLDNMSDNSSDSKRNINVAAETKFGGSVDVICSRGHFSYVFSSNLYCEASKGLTTCIAFRQAV